MKPGFALNLSPDGIGLLHRTPHGWTRVGEVSLDDPTFSETLGFLRKTALGLEPQGLTTKLIIPNSQILYTDVRAPGPDAASRRRQIRAALDGRTPYTVDELVFDWTPLEEEGRVRVAVVARETLQEAEEFAADHRMAPVSFVAMPDEGEFAGEPHFGATRLSTSLLPPGERVERDAEPVRLIGGAAPKAKVKPSKSPEPDAEATAGPESGDEAARTPAPDAAPASAAETTAALHDVEVPAEEPEVEDLDAEALRPGAAVAEPEVASAEEPPKDVAPEGGAETPMEATEAAVAQAGQGAAAEPTLAEPEPAEPEARPRWGEVAGPTADAPARAEAATDDEGSVEAPARAEVAAVEKPSADIALPANGAASRDDKVADEAAELEPAGAAGPAFASRRGATEGGARPTSPNGPRLSSAPSRISLPSAPAVELASLRAEPKPGKELAVPLRGKRGKPPPRPAPPPLRARVEITPQTPAEPPKPGLGLGAEALAVTPEASPLRPAEPPATASTRPAAAQASAGSSVFGAGSTRPVRGKPRYLGVVLTLVLLLILGLVAVWASLLGTPEQATITPGAGGAPPASLQLSQGVGQDAAPPMPGPEELLLAEDAPFLTEPGEEIPADATAPVADLAPPGGADLSPDAAAAAAPGNAVDVALQRPDQPAAPALAEVPRARPVLPSLNAIEADAPPDAQVDPAPADAVLAALAAAETAGGAPAPEAVAEAADAAAPAAPEAEPEEVFDVEVVLGSPETAPPPNPFVAAEETAVPQLDVTNAVLEALAAEVPVEETAAEGSVQLLEDPSLAGVRPRARPALPEDAATEADTPQAEDQGAVESATDGAEAPPVAFAGALRPRARPESASNASLVTIAPEPEPEVATGAVGSGGALAIAASLRPPSKPANFTAGVEQALAAALAAAPAPQPQQAARTPRDAVPDIDEDDEPDIVAAAVPNIPTRASVAAAATVTRGINLREMNLIGVAGTANNRRALVRMSNGRVVQVRVGDRLDGGQVAAIGDRQLRYVKSGRNLMLEIPQG